MTKLILSIIMFFVGTVAYTVAVQLVGRGMISSLVIGFTYGLIAYIWWNKKTKISSPLSEDKQPTQNAGFNYKIIIEFIKRNITLIAIAGIAIFLFYWFQIRPSQIISDCENFARNKSVSEEGLSLYEQLVFVGDYQDSYESCLRSKGLER